MVWVVVGTRGGGGGGQGVTSILWVEAKRLLSVSPHLPTKTAWRMTQIGRCSCRPGHSEAELLEEGWGPGWLLHFLPLPCPSLLVTSSEGAEFILRGAVSD